MNGPQTTFFGRLTRDPQELRYTANGGVAYITVSVAVNTYHGPDEEPEVHYYDVTLWRRHAENAMNRCRKGQQVYVEGRYSFREYTRRDGEKGHSHQVEARDFQYFTEPETTTGPENETASQKPTDPTPEPAAAEGTGGTEATQGTQETEQPEPVEGPMEPVDPFGDDLDSIES